MRHFSTARSYWRATQPSLTKVDYQYFHAVYYKFYCIVGPLPGATQTEFDQIRPNPTKSDRFRPKPTESDLVRPNKAKSESK